MAALTKRRLDAAKPAAKEYFLWCSATPDSEREFIPLERKCLSGKFASAEPRAE